MLLFTPGPTPVPESIRNAMAQETIHHRTPEFEAIFASVRTRLLKLFGMDEAVMLASSGSGAMEASVVNLAHNALLSVKAGKFGERFGKIAKAHGIENIELSYEWNMPAVVEDVVLAVKKNPSIDAIAIQVCESTGGLRHPVEEIAEAVKKLNPDIMVIADGITAVGVESIDVSHIDALIAGSQKAFMLPPGLAMIGLSDAAVRKIGSGKGFYFNLATEIKKQRTNTTAWTAPTTLIIGLGEFLDEVEKAGGFDALYKETARRSAATKEALKAVGLSIYPVSPAHAMSVVIDEAAPSIRKQLKEKYAVNVAGGQEQLKEKIFRINHMGFIPPYEALWAVNAAELALSDLGMRPFDATASKVFNQRYFYDS